MTSHSGLVWVRSDRPARMIVETSATESFRHAHRRHGPLLGRDTDFTGTTRLRGLPPGEQIHYRVLLADPDDPRRTGEPVTGTFRTVPVRRRDGVRFVWSGDLAGQGWGINPDLGGYRIYDAMGALDPDFFLCSGDNIYADGPIAETAALPDGGTWRNITTEEKSKVAETLAEFRGNFRYNLLDENLRRFNAQVPSIVQWDDHEVRNNWYPGQVIADTDDRYTEKRVDVLAARARRAFAEYFPVSSLRPGAREERVHRVLHQGPLLDVFVLDMRTYRNANSPANRPWTRRASWAASSWSGSSGSWRDREPCGRSSRRTCRSVSSCRTPPRARPTSRRSRRATPAHPWAASCRSPNCCASSSTAGSPAPCG